MQSRKNKFSIILVLLLLNGQFVFCQKKETKTIEGIFLFEEVGFVYNTYVVGDDAVVQGSSFLSYSNDFEILYKDIFELKYKNYLNNAPQVNHENYSFFYDLSSINSNNVILKNKPIRDYVINYQGIQFFLVYLKMEVESSIKKKRHIPYYDKKKGQYSSRVEKVNVYEIIDIKEYRIIDPKEVLTSSSEKKNLY